MKLYDEIIERKQYLKEENRSPNVGNFRYKKSKELNYILKGVLRLIDLIFIIFQV